LYFTRVGSTNAARSIPEGIESVSRINNLAQRYDNGCEFSEVLISNYDTNERLRDMPAQMGLFDLNDFYGMQKQI
jgi:DNA adenine methylase